MKHTDRCPRCQAPTHTRQMVDGTTVRLDAHPAPVASAETMVLLTDGTVLVSTPGSFHSYAVHRCEKGGEG